MSKEIINSKEWELIGEGATSTVYRPKDYRRKIALKLYSDPDDKDFSGDAGAARKTMQVMKTKLFEFPKNLPKEVVAPQGLFSQSGKIKGYTMPLIEGATPLEKYADALWRDEMKIDNAECANKTILPAFKNLGKTVSKIHEANVVIGDFSDKNVLVKDKTAYIIDADSFQFDTQFRNYDCKEMQDAFKDPLIIDIDVPKDEFNFSLKKGARASKDTDWYAYNVMLTESLLLVKPYGGTYKGISPQDRLQDRITIFDKNVKLPAWAIPYDRLPDDLIEYLKGVFVDDIRGKFPEYLLDMKWEKSSSGAEQAIPIYSVDKNKADDFIVREAANNILKDPIIYNFLAKTSLDALLERKVNLTRMFLKNTVPGQAGRFEARNTLIEMLYINKDCKKEIGVNPYTDIISEYTYEDEKNINAYLEKETIASLILRKAGAGGYNPEDQERKEIDKIYKVLKKRRKEIIKSSTKLEQEELEEQNPRPEKKGWRRIFARI